MAEDSKEVKSILKDFQASDEKIVLEAIKRNRKEGNSKTFEALLNTLKETDEPTVESAIIEFLFDLKDQGAKDILIQKLEDNSLAYYNSFLVATFWQSSIDGSDHLELFVQKAIEGDYMTCLEALTVVENFDSAFSEDEIQNCLLEITDALEDEEESDKKALLNSLKEVIQTLPIEGE
tara:strand:- start:702 stop:1235 length:534 start_codon:yes stop_codon:yes gene_type:complete